MSFLNLKPTLLIVFILLGVGRLNALTVASGTTLTLNNVNITEHIIVMPNAILEIAGSVVMGDPSNPSTELYIRILDGGHLYSNGGSITGLPMGATTLTWYGIVVEATVFPGATTLDAVTLNNFTLKHARRAIDMPPYSATALPAIFLMNRGITIENSIFDEIHGSYFVAGISPLFATGSWDNLNANNGINTVTFRNCQFLESADMWSFWSIRVKNLTVDNCLFDDANASGSHIGIHLRNANNSTITNSTFKQTGKCGITFHGVSKNVIIEKNTFDFDPSLSAYNIYSGVAIGYETMLGSAGDINISYNDFMSTSPAFKAHAIVAGSGAVSAGNESDGYLHSGRIDHNDINGFKYGIVVNNDWAGAFDDFTGEPDLKIYANIVDNYNIAMELAGANANTNVYCNVFKTGANALSIQNSAVTTVVADWGPGDLNNAFTGSFSDIINGTPTNFNYSKSITNPNAANTYAGPVTPIITGTLLDCSEDAPESAEPGTHELRDIVAVPSTIQVFPNPSKGEFTLNTDLFEESALTITSLTGAVVHQEPLRAYSTQIDLNNLAPGIYIAYVSNDSQQMSQKIIIE